MFSRGKTEVPSQQILIYLSRSRLANFMLAVCLCTSVFVHCTHMWGCVCACVDNENSGILVAALGFGLEQMKFLSS